VERAGFGVHVFSGVVEDPPESVILQLGAFLKERNCAAVVGLGGGSSLDAAKLGLFG
jgi:alcohol dehydrogenase class IV